ncbi:flagellar basal body L-ring protein FlgH [Novosphingobium sp. KCTC 2891]|uniref:flagellar basal body L-ring protein FlgH n=1 Tax=Novosphingobium sp. KCTC 2891 TaxID=2989730 RepID=UPI0022215A79|nr:flagellar basal body L-ring protein FlgH [Novosphingobium sp. KCTC 2891]
MQGPFDQPVGTSPSRMPRFAMLALTGLALGSAVCLAPPAQAKQRPASGFEPVLPAAPLPPTGNGAIFNVAAGYAGLVEGRRARAVGDPLTIMLVEQLTTSKSAGSKTQRSGDFNIVPPTAGPLSFLNPNALKASGGSSFNGQGNATQTSTLGGEVSVTITEVRTNGTALVKGEKRLLLSQGNEWVQFSGIVRLGDIDADNRIQSSRVADARIEYAGNGSVSRASREGWLSKFFNAISPF